MFGTFSIGEASLKEGCDAWIYFTVSILSPSTNTKKPRGEYNFGWYVKDT
jgi:hypothetical protein